MRWNRLSPGETGKAPRPFLVRPDLTLDQVGLWVWDAANVAEVFVVYPAMTVSRPIRPLSRWEAKIAQMSVSRPMREP